MTGLCRRRGASGETEGEDVSIKDRSSGIGIKQTKHKLQRELSHKKTKLHQSKTLSIPTFEYQNLNTSYLKLNRLFLLLHIFASAFDLLVRVRVQFEGSPKFFFAGLD